MTIYCLLGLIFLLSALMGAIAIPKIVSLSENRSLFDNPDKRKTHNNPTSRLGGVAFLPTAIVCTLLFCFVHRLQCGGIMPDADLQTLVHVAIFFLGTCILYGIGLTDDLVGVGYRSKFKAQMLVGILFCIGGLVIHSGFDVFCVGYWPSWLSVLATIFLVVYLTNAINLIDGIDGLASGICILAFILYGVLFAQMNNLIMLSIVLSLLGVLLIFFVFNVFGGSKGLLRKIFMGDTGSLTLGCAICFFMLVIEGTIIPDSTECPNMLFIVISPLIIPMLDVVRVVVVRYRAHVPMFMPDKRHIHHKLMRAGLTPHGTMVVLLLLTVFFIVLNYALAETISTLWLFAANAVSWILMNLIVHHFDRCTSLNNMTKK